MQMENASLLAVGPYLRNPFLSLEHMNITDFLKNLDTTASNAFLLYKNEHNNASFDCCNF